MAKKFTPARFLDSMEVLGFRMSGEHFILPRGLKRVTDLPREDLAKTSALLTAYRNFTPEHRKALLEAAEKRMARRARGFDASTFITAVENTRHNLTLLLHGNHFIGALLWGRSECERFAPVPTKEDRAASDALVALWHKLPDRHRVALIDEVRKRVIHRPYAEVVGTVGEGWQPASPISAAA